MEIRTRIAPSPTGFFHIGTARTALFNYLFAKKLNGRFFLRIEDTDKERSKKAYEDNIIDGLKWLGLNWDGEITRQSERTAVYKKYLQKLIDERRAFYCFHTQDELKEEQKEQELKKLPYQHKCDHKNLTESKIKARENENSIIRLLNPDRRIVFNDMVRGEVVFESELLGDLSLAKDLDSPLYNFAVVVDDHEMEITHVLRGEDHLSNTPKQLLIQEALGFKQPEYAHLPLILGPDKSKISKRHGATFVGEYRDQGYLPQAMVNFMALLGWHPHDTNQEIFSLEELIKEFELERVQKGGAVFDIKKLDSINHHYIQNIVPAELTPLIQPYLSKYNPQENLLIKIAHLFRDRLHKLSEIGEVAKFIFELSDYDSKTLVWKHSSAGAAKENLELMLSRLEKIEPASFDIDTLATEIMPIADEKGRGEFLWPLRVALSGLDKSPGPFEIMAVLGREESLKRIRSAIEKLA